MTYSFEKRCGLLILLMVWVSGCAAFRGGNLPEVPVWPLNSSVTKKSVNLIVNAKAWINEKGIPADKVESTVLGTWRTQCLKAYEESGLFSDVRPSLDQEADLTIDIDIEKRTEFSEALAFLLGFTFALSSTVIPQREKNDFLITSVIKERDGHVTGSYKKSESVSTWIWLFWIFAMPFRDGPDTVMTQTLYDLNRATISEAHDKGVI